MENDGVGDKELLLARSDKRYKKICRGVQHVSENGE